ncbi:hypothetical protein V1358_03205 [Pseudoalteromonas sp. YIC-656]|uniref:hypothetical protein n=1 Tax=Pseudoalteromonas pernae TaxID=3118054 RepID=UPI00324280E0
MDKIYNLNDTGTCSLLQAAYFTMSVIVGGYLLSLAYQNEGNVSLLTLKQVLSGNSNISAIFSTDNRANPGYEIRRRTTHLYKVSNYTEFALDDETRYFSPEQSIGLPGLLLHFMFTINNGDPNKVINHLNRTSPHRYSLLQELVPFNSSWDDFSYFWVAKGDVSVVIEKPLLKLVKDGKQVLNPASILETFIQLYSYEEVKLIMATRGWLHKFDNKRLQHYNIILEYDDTGKFQKMSYR